MVPVVRPDNWNLACLVASPSSCKVNAASEKVDPPPPVPMTSTLAPFCLARNLAAVLSYQTSPSTGLARSPAAGVRRRPFCTLVRPVARSNAMASVKAKPSALTLMAKSSLPAVPISARPANPVWNIRLAVSVAAALLIFT